MMHVRKSGRLANGAERDKGRVVHFGETGFCKALCGAKPAIRSAMGFIETDLEVNCERCLKKYGDVREVRNNQRGKNDSSV